MSAKVSTLGRRRGFCLSDQVSVCDPAAPSGLEANCATRPRSPLFQGLFSFLCVCVFGFGQWIRLDLFVFPWLSWNLKVVLQNDEEPIDRVKRL